MLGLPSPFSSAAEHEARREYQASKDRMLVEAQRPGQESQLGNVPWLEINALEATE